MLDRGVVLAGRDDAVSRDNLTGIVISVVMDEHAARRFDDTHAAAGARLYLDLFIMQTPCQQPVDDVDGIFNAVNRFHRLGNRDEEGIVDGGFHAQGSSRFFGARQQLFRTQVEASQRADLI